MRLLMWTLATVVLLYCVHMFCSVEPVLFRLSAGGRDAAGCPARPQYRPHRAPARRKGEIAVSYLNLLPTKSTVLFRCYWILSVASKSCGPVLNCTVRFTALSLVPARFAARLPRYDSDVEPGCIHSIIFFPLD